MGDLVKKSLAGIVAGIAVFAAVAGVLVLRSNNSPDSGSSSGNRQRNAALDSLLDPTFGNGGSTTLFSNEGPLTVMDSTTMSDGTIFSTGYVDTPAGIRAWVSKTTNGSVVSSAYVLDPSKLQDGSTLLYSLGRRVAIQDDGSVFVLLDDILRSSSGTETHKTVIHKLGNNLMNLSWCSFHCGISYSLNPSITDIAVNSKEQVLGVLTSTTVKSLYIRGSELLPLSTNYHQCGTDPTRIISQGDGFVFAGANSQIIGRFRAGPSLITACNTGSMSDLSRFADVVLGDDGRVHVLGSTSSGNLVTYVFDPSTLQLQTRSTAVVPRLDDETPTSGYPGTIVAKADGTEIISANVAGSGGAMVTMLAEIQTAQTPRLLSAVTSSSLQFTEGAPSPILGLTGNSLTLVTPSKIDSRNAAWVGKFNVKSGISNPPPAWPAANQTAHVAYGRDSVIPLAIPSIPAWFQVSTGALPQGLSLSTSGTISGMPLKTGRFEATIQATNDGGSSTSRLTIIVDAVTPGSPIILTVRDKTAGPALFIDTQNAGSDVDVVKATAVGADSHKVVIECSSSVCQFDKSALHPGVLYTATVSAGNPAGSADSINSVQFSSVAAPEQVTGISVTPEELGASVTFDTNIKLNGSTINGFVVRLFDKEGLVAGQLRNTLPVVFTGLDSVDTYTVTVTPNVTAGEPGVPSLPSSPFKVLPAKPKLTKPVLTTEQSLVIPARMSFAFPLSATGSDDITYSVNTDILPAGISFDGESRIQGGLNPGVYTVEYSATNELGTTEGTVEIIVEPGQLPVPVLWPSINTYDGKYSFFAGYGDDDLASDAVDHLEWAAQFTVDGQARSFAGICRSDMKCQLPEAPFGGEMTLTLRAIPVSDSGDSPSDAITHIVRVPEREPRVPVTKATFKRAESPAGLGIVEAHAHMTPSLKFALDLRAAGQIQVDAVTGCDLHGDRWFLNGQPADGCTVDPYLRLLNGEDVVEEDDDGGAFMWDSESEDGEVTTTHGTNLMSSRLSSSVETGRYVVEASDLSDIRGDNSTRGARGEFDLYIVIITTPEEADRLVGSTLPEETFTPQLPEPTVVKIVSAGVIQTPTTAAEAGPPIPLPAAPKTEAAGTVRMSVGMVSVSPSNKALVVTPTVGSAGGKTPEVTVVATPGNGSCISKDGAACTINGLSPWVNYVVTARAEGDTLSATSTGTPWLVVKAGTKVKVSGLGLSSAAKLVKSTVKKGGLRVSGNCSLNPARTSIAFGKSGTCTVTAQTTQKVKSKTIVGPPLTATILAK